MNKEEFLLDPVQRLAQEGHSIPIDWIKEAWANAQFRANTTYELVRSVRKNGDFFIAQHWLQVLPEILTSEQVVELYLAIREQSHRYEDEWRGEFEAAFRRFADKLPPPRVAEQPTSPNPEKQRT
jgi:hypothetical protein